MASAEILANWSFGADEWSRFGEYEGWHYQKLVKQTRSFFFVVLILALLALLVVPAFGIIRIAPWDRGLIVAVFVIILFGGGLLEILAIIWSIQQKRLSALSAASGEIVITATSINSNGVVTEWNYDDVLGNRFYDARTMTINKGKPGEMDLLEVRTIAYTQTSHAARDVISSCRVPIPAGKREDAERIVLHLLSMKGISQ